MINSKLTFKIEDINFQKHRDAVRNAMGNAVLYKQTELGYKYLTGIKDSYGIDFIFSESKSDYYSEPFTSRLISDISSNSKGIGIFAGGYIGDMAVIAALNGMQCIAFEPDPESRHLMQMNARLNSVNINVVEQGLYSSKCEKKLVLDDATSTLYDNGDLNNAEYLNIELIDLDSFLSDFQSDEGFVNLIQFDMEGAETEAILGAVNTINKHSPFLIIEIHSLYDDFRSGLSNSKTVKLLHSLDYNVYCLRDYNTSYQVPSNHPYELVPVSNCFVHGPHHGFNLIGFRGKIPQILSNHSVVVDNVSPKLIPSRAHDSKFAMIKI